MLKLAGAVSVLLVALFTFGLHFSKRGALQSEAIGVAPTWVLSFVADNACSHKCVVADHHLSAVLGEMGNFADQVEVVTKRPRWPVFNALFGGGAGSGAEDDTLYTLYDPTGRAVAHFGDDISPRRMAARIRILMSGRFDAEIAEVCSPLQADATPIKEVRDRWQNDL